jgi:anti-sigma regulatory factor (Ser/Thr protein kinase)
MKRGVKVKDGGGGNEALPLRAGLDLEPALTTAWRARTFVSEMLEVWDCDDPDEVAILLTSEVVTNAVRHTTESIRLELSLGADGALVVETTDDHPARPFVKPTSTTREGGRGMLMVERLARRWGVRPAGGHKVVWFEVVVVPRGSKVATVPLAGS